MLKMGQHGKDKISGFTGVVTGRAEYLTGCTQVLLTPTSLAADGKRRDGEWFDEQRIDAVGDTVVVLNNANTPGADEPLPPAR